MRSLPRPRWATGVAFAAFAGLELGFAVWVAFVAHGRIVDPRVGYGPDSVLYLTAARAPVWSRRFLAGPGAFGFLLLAKLSARNLRAIVVVQTLLAIAAWSFLAATAIQVVRSNLARWIALLGVLGLALAPGILQWNAMIATESLSVSSLCVVFACGLRLALGATRPRLAWFLAALAAFAYTRDTNALVAGAIGIAAIVCAVRRPVRRPALLLGATGLALALSASALANAAEPPRWYWPVAETTAVRLLDDPVATRFLVAHGFPWSDPMRTLPARYIYLYDPVRKGPTFGAFRYWVRRDGRRTYAGFLLRHPGWALRKPFDDREAFFDLGTIELYGRTYRNRPGAPYAAIGSIGGLRAPGATEVWAAGAAIGLGLVIIRRRVRPAVAGVVAFAGVLAIVGYYAAWHGDALEVYRHALSAAVQLRIALWIATALVVDALVAGPVTSEVRVPQDADLHQEQHEGAPRDEPAGAVADSGAEGGERAR